MRKEIVMLTIAAIMLAAPMAMAKSATTVEGTFKGALCSYLGKSHPATLTDAQVALEPDFVLRDASGEDHFITNLPRAKKLPYINEKVRIAGSVNEQGTLCAECLEVFRGGSYVKVWTLAQERAERQALLN